MIATTIDRDTRPAAREKTRKIGYQAAQRRVSKAFLKAARSQDVLRRAEQLLASTLNGEIDRLYSQISALESQKKALTDHRL